jgi:cytoskeletal protein CcmA (bactofilin family)
MFTRSSTAEPKTLEPIKSNAGGLNMPHQPPRPATMSGVSEVAGRSVIGNDLKIIGQGLRIISQGTLQVDGEVEGDVGGAEVIIGEQGKVTGTVAAERVIVRGKISGVIRGVTVTLQSSSRVEGDIHHLSLAIEQGAEFDGRCRRPADAAELNLNIEPSAAARGQPPMPPGLRTAAGG